MKLKKLSNESAVLTEVSVSQLLKEELQKLPNKVSSEKLGAIYNKYTGQLFSSAVSFTEEADKEIVEIHSIFAELKYALPYSHADAVEQLEGLKALQMDTNVHLSTLQQRLSSSSQSPTEKIRLQDEIHALEQSLKEIEKLSHFEQIHCECLETTCDCYNN